MRELDEQELEQVAGGITISESSHATLINCEGSVSSVYSLELPFLDRTIAEALADPFFLALRANTFYY